MKRIAVIAVHGVADQRPTETAHAIAGLLANLDNAAGPLYAPFRERRVDVPVRRLDVPRRREASGAFYNRAPQLRERRCLTIDVGGDHPTKEFDAGLEFMASQLADYAVHGPDETYRAIVLEGSRLSDDGDAAIAVDVYEMYWADLSRLTTNVFRVFGEVFQLLFHVA